MNMGDFLYFFGALILLSFIISTAKYVRFRIKQSKEIKRYWKQQYEISNTTWLCPRCQERVKNELTHCKCGQPRHNIGKKHKTI